jgi:hypothetical protein
VFGGLFTPVIKKVAVIEPYSKMAVKTFFSFKNFKNDNFTKKKLFLL